MVTKMNVLLVYANEISGGCMPIGLAMISAVAKKAGHKVSLFDTSFLDNGAVQERELREKYLEHKKIKNSEEKILQKEKKDIAEEFKKAIIKNSPDLIAVGCTSTEFYFIRPYLQEIKKMFNLPILIGGIHATVAPEKTIKEEFVDMICVGEGEDAIVELLDKMSKKKDYTNIKNIWVKKGKKLFKNEIRPLIQDLDKLPFPDWELFDKRHFIRPFQGKLTRYGFFEFGRGCPFFCTYCVNSYLHKAYKGKGNYHREKSAERMIGEMEAFKNKFGLNHVQFVDDTFLTINKEKLTKFVQLYKEKIGATMFIMSRAETINEETIRLLKNVNCTMVAIGVETGNEKFREKVCKRFIKNSVIINAFSLLKKRGIETQSYNIIGFPHENRKLFFDTIKLNRLLKPDQFTLKFLYPFEGTEIRQMCIDGKYIPDADTDPRVYETSILKMPQISRKELRGLRKTAILYIYLPYLVWPLIKLCERENFISKRLYNLLAKFVKV